MAPEDLPSEVKLFVRGYIDSVGQLEILLLLHDNPGKEWSPAEVNDRLRSSLSSVETRLAGLAARRLVAVRREKPLAYQYEPATPELTQAIDRLSSVYHDFRGRVIDFLFSSGDRLKNFSDAFHFREEDKNG